MEHALHLFFVFIRYDVDLLYDVDLFFAVKVLFCLSMYSKPF